jgi:peptidoglycan/LPS O-acetylase OafA/YrhL
MQQGRVLWVDALRAFAALSVAWFHLYTEQAHLMGLPGALTHLALFGRFGVELFFAISGFVLTITLLPRQDLRGPREIGLYLVRRSVRLDPTLWVVIIAFMVAQPWLAPRVYAGGVTLQRTIASFLYFLPLPSGNGNYVNTAWTLAIEIQFYLLFAAMIAIINRLAARGLDRGLAAVAGVALMALVGAPQYLRLTDAPVGFWIYPHLVNFAVGAAAALVFLKMRGARPLFAGVTALALIGGVLIGNRALATFVCAAIFWMMVSAPRLQAWLGDRRLVYLGALSYGVYLLQGLTGALTIDALARLYPRVGGLHILDVVVAIVVTCLAAMLLHHFVEQPSIRLSKRIGPPRRRMSSSDPAPAYQAS